MALGRRLQSWLAGFLEFTEGSNSPPLFRKWAAITAIGACLERRTWTITNKGPTYPNLYTILIGRPGIGKSEAIGPIQALIRATYNDGIFNQACHIAPSDVTKAALYDFLSSKLIKREGPNPEARALGIQELAEYHSAFLVISELGTLIREHDSDLLTALLDLFDCPPFAVEQRRYRADNPIKILRPQLSLLGGTTPAYMSRTFPALAWDEGFMARAVLIYAADGPQPDPFADEIVDPLLSRELVEDLRAIGAIQGQYEFSDDAKTSVRAWIASGQAPVPQHIRLQHYNTRRRRFSFMLSMIACANRCNDLVITAADFQEALGWMVEAEDAMGQIFLEMTGKSDGQVMQELYHWVKGVYEFPLKYGRPVQLLDEGQLIGFLTHKVQAWQVPNVLDMAEKAGYLVKVPQPNGSKKYKPAPSPHLLRPGKPN